MTPKEGTILSKIDSPKDLKNLNDFELVKLCNELREFILDVVSVHPGHLGSSLGVVELTVAVHKVFDTPYDRLIWDVGHQAYGHKILTGRRNQFYTNRQYGGIGGFPIRSESEYDAFGTGHASTSISAALGMSEASKLKGESDRKHIAIIGDGALTGGMAFEGINNAGTTDSDILIILNDNGISIDENVGSLKNYFSQIASSAKYDLKNWKALGVAIKNVDDLSKNKSSIKGNFQRKSNLFEAMNFAYFGPVDGHDVQGLIEVLNEIKSIPGPKLLHIITKKGKGFKKAEEEQTLYHAPGKFDRQTGEINSETISKNSTYQEVYGKTLLELATSNEKIIGITPAMPTGSAMNYMRDKYPNRVFDVGIAEQHAVTFAAGIAAEGFKPFCTIYSTFLQRAYDQVIHDVALQKLPVVFAIDRAGLVGEDGATHHGVFDISFMSTIPNMIVCAPMNEVELRNFMFTASSYKNGPIAIRYPRRKGTIQNWETVLEKVEIGKGRIVIKGNKIAILTIGHAGNIAMEAIKKLNETGIFPSLIDMRFIAPLDTKLLHEVFENYDLIITVEDGIISGGLGSKVITFKNNNDFTTKIVTMGVPDKFIGHGNVESLYKESGYDTKSIVSNIKKYYSKIN
ncbi:MAG: 1-deoxy-D-xylulose-5-phosphate synthase [Bacteroidales bacterium]|jgi:1-deoxy-D-xylulose-5-phosphate synthase|nr:1-deoxy-D-xylulose-5-phosphate synthase [Bacteroidales bacterium]